METTKIMPNALNLEEVVLGAILIDSRAIDDVADILSADMFYKEAHKRLYNELLKLFNTGRPIDIMTVSVGLKSSGEFDKVGGYVFLTSLTQRVSSAANIEYHSRIIAQKYIQRKIIESSTKIIESAFSETEDIFDIISASEIEKDEMLNTISVKKEQSNRDVLFETIKDIDKQKIDGVTGIPSGFIDLDKITAGWQKSDLIILAARPGMGKTSFVLQCGINAAKRKKKVAFFSLEMSSKQLMKKEIAIVTGLPLQKIVKQQLSVDDISIINRNTETISDLNIIWDDSPGISITELRAKCRKLKRKEGIEMIVIDYLQLMTTGEKNRNMNREGEISLISRSLKALAKEIDIPVIALSQLSRAVEARADKRPMLSDLRESGAIEQDADMVCFLFRPEYYGINEYEGGEGTEGKCELIIAKHRNGETDEIMLSFNKQTTGFFDDYPAVNYPVPSGGIAPSTAFDAPF